MTQIGEGRSGEVETVVERSEIHEVCPWGRVIEIQRVR